MSQVAKLKAAIAKYATLVHLGCKKYILNLLDAEAKLEDLEAHQDLEAHEDLEAHTDTDTLTVWTNRNKGINAYLINSKNSEDIYYGKPIDKEAQERAYRGKSHQVRFDLGKIPDGTYRLKECCGSSWHKVQITYIVLSQGKILKTVDKLEDLIDKSNLPELEGSIKQAQWAESIRSKFLSECDRCGVEYPQWVFEQQSAKYWIESRHGLKLHLSM